MSFNDPVRLSFEGDRAEAFRYIRPARALLLKLAREVSNAGSATARRRFVLGDGAIIEIGLAGLQSTVHIVTPEAAGARVRVQEHFVVWPREGDPPESIDEDHPQLMIRFADDEFATLFYDADIEGYEDFEGTRGTYRTDRGEVVFPDGVRHAGNVDWRSSEGLRVSWYGPSSRYFVEPYVQPRVQYGTKVFMLGQELFDSDEYMADSDITFPERWVMGAAVSPDRRWLLVVHAELPVGTTTTGTAPPQTAEMSNPFPPGTMETASPVPIVICRYRLTRDNTVSDAMNFSVVPESREVLAAQSLDGALNPWFFNGDASYGVSVGVPQAVAVVYYQQGEMLSPPSTTSQLFEFNGAINTRTLSVPPGGQGVAAVDFDDDGRLREFIVRRGTLNDSLDSTAFEFRGADWDARTYWRISPPGWSAIAAVHRSFVWGDLRAGAFVFLRSDGQVSTDGSVSSISHALEFWDGGVLIREAPVLNNPDPNQHAVLPWVLAIASQSTLHRRLMDPSPDQPVSPLQPLYAAHATVSSGLAGQSYFYYAGLIGGYRAIVRDPASYFGHFAFFGQTRTPIASRAIPSDATTLPDTDGVATILGAASYGGVTMFSGHDFFGSNNHEALHHVAAAGDPPQLPDLTGVDGSKARYHPIWLLGTLPSREIA